MHVHVNKGFSFLKVIQNCKYEKKKKYGNLCTFHLQCGSNKRTY